MRQIVVITPDAELLKFWCILAFGDMCVCKTKQKLDDVFPMHYSKFVSLTCTKRYKLYLLFGEADELKYNRACKDQRQSEESQKTFHLNI